MTSAISDTNFNLASIQHACYCTLSHLVSSEIRLNVYLKAIVELVE